MTRPGYLRTLLAFTLDVVWRTVNAAALVCPRGDQEVLSQQKEGCNRTGSPEDSGRAGCGRQPLTALPSALWPMLAPASSLGLSPSQGAFWGLLCRLSLQRVPVGGCGEVGCCPFI